ncbi:MAG TPA: ferritin-like domain-containing protein [Kribbella sp.]|uniref:ferritin-like domain-containing protein n=1 Tax=Kribbella sp. TaxID=1871183 RepID=UPI002D78CDDD|nr:ferritin-like domain-containing protein [Kribbella sp.]HET6296003.1 ferritin-like domain-containing protein [Kribbella sp.]
MTETDALQAAIAGEHAALYGVGVAGGKLTGARFTAATTQYEQHRKRRDQLAQLLIQAGQTPAAAEPAYDLPQAVTNAATATALVLLIERRLSAVYGDLVESAEMDKVRTFAVQALIATARDQLTWGGAPAAFPGDV